MVCTARDRFIRAGLKLEKLEVISQGSSVCPKHRIANILKSGSLRYAFLNILFHIDIYTRTSLLVKRRKGKRKGGLDHLRER